MRNLLIIFLLGMVATHSFSQQEAQYSNYQMNNFMLNPAVAGSYSFFNAKVGYRMQWAGMEGGPRTMFASIQGPIKKPRQSMKRKRRKGGIHHGIGGTFQSDQAGAISYQGFNGTYAIHTQLNNTFTLSLGASLGVKVFTLDGSKLKFIHTGDDPELSRQIYSDVMPDMNLGGWLYSETMFFGVSARQVLQNEISLKTENLETNDYSKLHNHYFITAGTMLTMTEDWSFIPSIMLQSVRPAPLQVDLNGTFLYDKRLGLGFSYRHLDAVYFIFEYVHDEKFEFSYAFDLTLSELNKYNSGTHEVIIGVRWARKGQVLCPAKFW